MKLLLEIVHCPIIQSCWANPNDENPCTEIVGLQPKSKSLHQVPEPWSGHLEQAPILFLSSNPSISDTEVYPRGDWLDEDIEDYFVNRFGGGKKKWIQDGIKGLQDDGHSYGNATRFWVAVRKHASDLLRKGIRDVRPGIDYALTEVVHCKSRDEKGVSEALTKCAELYLRQLIESSGASVIVVLGATVRDTVRNTLGVPASMNVFGPTNIGPLKRYVVFLPHSNARGYRSFERCLPEQLPTLQSFLQH